MATSKDSEPNVFSFIPDEAVETRFHQFEDFEFSSLEDVNRTLVLMFEHPEREFYYFVRQGYPINLHLKEAIDDNWLLADTVVNFFYRHPDHPSMFMRVKDSKISPENQAKITSNSHPFTRFTLTITERCKRKFEIDQLLYRQSKLAENPLEVKPGAFGISINLFKIIPWLKSTISKFRT